VNFTRWNKTKQSEKNEENRDGAISDDNKLRIIEKKR
jgi:hypothetical protein